VLRLYRAYELKRWELPEVFALRDRLARRAGLARPPKLYLIPSRMLNAFAVGRPDDAVIALTDGLVRSMTLREIAGCWPTRPATSATTICGSWGWPIWSAG
jgi:heat shock protein HtpX